MVADVMGSIGACSSLWPPTLR